MEDYYEENEDPIAEVRICLYKGYYSGPLGNDTFILVRPIIINLIRRSKNEV